MNLPTQALGDPQCQRYSRRPGLRNSAMPLHQRLLSKKMNTQIESPLFTLFPPEIRTKIFTYALSEYEDTCRRSLYDTKTSFWRPSHRAPRKTSTELLRTCRAIYRETWFLPFRLKEQTHWICSDEYAPPGKRDAFHSIPKLKQMIPKIAQQGQEKVEIESLYIFASMCDLESCEDLNELLCILHPRRITLRIRYIDWPGWEFDPPSLCFQGVWINRVCESFSPLTTELKIELESLEHKKDRIDAIGQQMAERWFFGRFGGTILYADVSGKCHEESRWTGSSSWHNKLWTEYEKSKTPTLDYYVLAITFESELSLKRKGGVVSEKLKRDATNPLNQHAPVVIGTPKFIFITAEDMEKSPGCGSLPLPSELTDEDF